MVLCHVRGLVRRMRCRPHSRRISIWNWVAAHMRHRTVTRLSMSMLSRLTIEDAFDEIEVEQKVGREIDSHQVSI